MGAALPPEPTNFVELDQIDSTNAEAMRRVLAGERGPLYIRAERQTAGRGRSGRQWVASQGNLALSRLGPVGCSMASVPQLSLVAGVAIYRAAMAVLGERIGHAALLLKWPNDVLLDGAKLAGVLVEATSIQRELVAVVGIGCNVAHAPDIANRRTTALATATHPPDPAAFGRLVALHLEAVLGLWDDGRGFEMIRQAWLSASTALGTEMSIQTSAGLVRGFFGGLDDDGGLILRDGRGATQKYTYGDVRLASEREMS